MDQRIADYVRENRGRYTRQAMIDKLLEAGYSRESIDATLAALDTPDPDSTAGEGFWSRFFPILIGVNVVIFVAVALLSGFLAGPAPAIIGAILLVALAIGAFIAWGIVAATQPTRLNPRTAIVIGTLIPVFLALMIGGSCYALVSGTGGGGPPPTNGSANLTLDPPPPFQGEGPAQCAPAPDGFSIFADEVGRLDGMPVSVQVQVGTAPGQGDYVTLFIFVVSQAPDQQELSYSSSQNTSLILDPGATAFGGALRFNDLERDGGGESISGILTWQCK